MHNYNLRPRKPATTKPIYVDDGEVEDDMRFIYNHRGDSIDLSKWVRKDRREVVTNYVQHREALCEEQCDLCRFCKKPISIGFNVHIDHIIPKKNNDIYSDRVLNSKRNLQAICSDCHKLKTRFVDPLINEQLNEYRQMEDERGEEFQYPRLRVLIEELKPMMFDIVRHHLRKIRSKHRQIRQRNEDLREVPIEVPMEVFIEIPDDPPMKEVPEDAPMEEVPKDAQEADSVDSLCDSLRSMKISTKEDQYQP